MNMKIKVLFLFCVAGVLGCTPQDTMIQSKPKEPSPIYPFKSAVITYFFEGGRNATEGTKTIYIDQWGKFQAEKIDSNLANDDRRVEWTITRDHVQYSFNEEDMRLVKTHLMERKPDGIDLDALAYEKGGLKEALVQLREEGTQILLDEQVAGYPCQVIDQKLTNVLHEKRWIYQGIALKRLRYLNMPNELVEGLKEIATHIEFDCPVELSVFELPDGLATE